METPAIALALDDDSSKVHGGATDDYRLPNLKTIVTSMEPEDSAFIQNVVKYVATLDRNNEKNMKFQSNTRLPRRFLFSITNIPTISLNELYKIECMNSNIRMIQVDVLSGSIRVDVWKRKCSERGKRKRADSPPPVEAYALADWNLEGLRTEDRKACKSILDSIMEMPEVLCQFKTDIEEDPPHHYILKLYLKDTVRYSKFKSLKLDFRAFIDSIEFNFHEKSVLIVIKRI